MILRPLAARGPALLAPLSTAAVTRIWMPTVGTCAPQFNHLPRRAFLTGSDAGTDTGTDIDSDTDSGGSDWRSNSDSRDDDIRWHDQRMGAKRAEQAARPCLLSFPLEDGTKAQVHYISAGDEGELRAFFGTLGREDLSRLTPRSTLEDPRQLDIDYLTLSAVVQAEYEDGFALCIRERAAESPRLIGTGLLTLGDHYSTVNALAIKPYSKEAAVHLLVDLFKLARSRGQRGVLGLGLTDTDKAAWAEAARLLEMEFERELHVPDVPNTPGLILGLHQLPFWNLAFGRAVTVSLVRLR